MRADGLPDQIVLRPVVFDDREGDGERAVDTMAIHAAQQIVRRARTFAVARHAKMSVRIEDAKSRFHNAGSADTIRRVICCVLRCVLRSEPMSRVRAAGSASTVRTAVRIISAPDRETSAFLFITANHSNIIATERMVATGLATPLPAMSGAEP